MELKKEFVLRALQPSSNMSALCREFGISRKTGYKWMSRYKSGAGLREQSRRPHSNRLEVSGELVCEVIRLKSEHPRWGPKKLHALLSEKDRPSVRTVARILSRAGLVRERVRRRAPHAARAPRVEVAAPNDLWTIDFKGGWRTLQGSRCEPLTIRDAHSRFILAIRALPGTSLEPVREAMEDVFEHYGYPKAILSDNGSPFACTQSLGGYSKLSAWWASLGIAVFRGRPGCPQDNGGHERMHLDLRLEVQSRPGRTLDDEQEACDVFRRTFNEVRPHEALGQSTPASVYRRDRSPQVRALPTVPTECEVRTVKSNGTLLFQGERCYIGRPFAGHPIGLRTLEENRYEIWFYGRRLAIYTPGASPAVTEVEHSSDEPKEGTAKYKTLKKLTANR